MLRAEKLKHALSDLFVLEASFSDCNFIRLGGRPHLHRPTPVVLHVQVARRGTLLVLETMDRCRHVIGPCATLAAPGNLLLRDLWRCG